MNKKLVSECLQALASSDGRPKAARLRDVVDDVEAALAAGVSRAAILSELAAHGLEMSLSTFETTLKRIRRRRRQAQGNRYARPDGGPAPAPAPGAALTGRRSHSPTDLDAILGSAPDLGALAKLAKGKQQ